MEGRRQQALLSEAEFLAWAEPRDERCELVEGEIVMQAGASRDHERVAKAVFATLYAQLDPGVFDVNKGDLGVRVSERTGRGTVLYPDVVVDRQSDDGDARVTTTTVVIVEVLSPSTDLDHHIRKLERYRRFDSLAIYLVCDQKTSTVRVWRKGAQAWPAMAVVVEGLGASIDLAEVGATIRLADVYRRPPDSRRR